jgi:DNA primase
MNVLELVIQKGIDPKRVSSNKGGEYHSSCPMCGDGGKGPASNRFHIWPEQRDGSGSWWCRYCGRGGDRIALVMAMDGLSYKEACASLGIDMPDTPSVPFKPRQSARRRPPSEYEPSKYQRPKDQWREHAEKFATWAHRQLIDNHPEDMDRLFRRGIDPSTVLRWGLGWNPGKKGKDLFRARESWGLETIEKDDGKKKKLWLPRGLVIPYRRDGVLERIRIRRPKDHLRSENDARYYVVPGSSAMPWIIGEKRRAYTVIETELDGLLVDQEACRLTGVLALGSSSNMPDGYCHLRLADSLVILNALDFDHAGAKAWPKWKAAYPQAERWPVPVGKDPGEAYQAGVDIATWVLAGLPPVWHVGLSPYAAKGLQGAEVESRPKDADTAGAGDGAGSSGDRAAAVAELGDLLRRYPVRVVNSAERTGVETPSAFRNDAICKRISDLVFNDPDCVNHLLHHPDEIITGGNFYHG